MDGVRVGCSFNGWSKIRHLQRSNTAAQQQSTAAWTRMGQDWWSVGGEVWGTSPYCLEAGRAMVSQRRALPSLGARAS